MRRAAGMRPNTDLATSRLRCACSLFAAISARRMPAMDARGSVISACSQPLLPIGALSNSGRGTAARCGMCSLWFGAWSLSLRAVLLTRLAGHVHSGRARHSAIGRAHSGRARHSAVSRAHSGRVSPLAGHPCGTCSRPPGLLQVTHVRRDVGALAVAANLLEPASGADSGVGPAGPGRPSKLLGRVLASVLLGSWPVSPKVGRHVLGRVLPYSRLGCRRFGPSTTTTYFSYESQIDR